MLVCPSCFGESQTLSARFAERGADGDCPTCGTENVKVLEASELSDLFEGIKEHYEPLIGDPYRLGKFGISGLGPSSGDDSLIEILREDWEVFSDSIDDDTAEEILTEIWPGYVGEYMQRGSKAWRQVEDEWERLKQSLMHEWRYFQSGKPVSEVVARLLDPWSELLETTLATRDWRRARIQESRGRIISSAEMGAPPPEKARAGRANPAGIPHLYVASDQPTAVAEVRAEPADWVTVATVTIDAAPMRVLDLTRDVRIVDPYAHKDLHEALMHRELLQVFSYELGRPIRAGDSEFDYVATQFIAEYFRDKGVGGIIFPSSLASGRNAVFFDPNVATIGPCVEATVWSKSVDVIDANEFDRRDRKRRGYRF